MLIIQPDGSGKIKIPGAFRYLDTAARHKGAHGGRGSAKSHTFATRLLLYARDAPKERPELIACFREVQNSIKDSVKALLDNKIDEMGLRRFFNSTDDQIVGLNKSRFIFKGMHGAAGVNSVRSTEGITKAWIEEAQSVSQPSIDALIPTVRRPGSELWWTWNPVNATDPVDMLLRGSETPPRSIVKEVNYIDNPWFPPELREEMEFDKRRDPDKYAHIWMGQYKTNSEARVFRNWRIEAFETPKKTIFYQGADWGFAQDPSVLVRCFIDGKRLYIDYEAYKIGCEIDDLPKLFAGRDGVPEDLRKTWGPGDENKWPGIPNARQVMITADSARPETISFMSRHGFRISPALKGKGSVEDGIEWLKNYDIIVHPRCRHTIDELSFYSWKVDPKKIDPNTKQPEVTNILEDKQNHVIDALRYSIEGVRRGIATWQKLGAA